MFSGSYAFPQVLKLSTLTTMGNLEMHRFFNFHNSQNCIYKTSIILSLFNFILTVVIFLLQWVLFMILKYQRKTFEQQNGK